MEAIREGLEPWRLLAIGGDSSQHMLSRAARSGSAPAGARAMEGTQVDMLSRAARSVPAPAGPRPSAGTRAPAVQRPIQSLPSRSQ